MPAEFFGGATGQVVWCVLGPAVETPIEGAVVRWTGVAVALIKTLEFNMGQSIVPDLHVEKVAGQSLDRIQEGDEKSSKKTASGRCDNPGLRFKVQLLFMLLMISGVGTAWYLAVNEWRGYTHEMQSQTEMVKAEILNLRSLLLTDIEERLIRLKILVLRHKVDISLVNEIAAAVSKYSKIYNKDPDLILAVMRVESAFDPLARSSVGAMGLMQIMPHWIEVLDIQCDLDEPDCNTKYGIQILGAYEQMYGSMDMALTAYNRGPGPVDAALMRGKDPDNGYAGKVQTIYSRLRSINGPENNIELASLVNWK